MPRPARITRGQLLERFPALEGLAPARLERLLAEAQLMRMPAGSVLFDAQQPCRGFPLLLEGSVREIVSRLLRSFETRGWVRLERERITLTDPKSLAALGAPA